MKWFFIGKPLYRFHLFLFFVEAVYDGFGWDKTKLHALQKRILKRWGSIYVQSGKLKF